MIVCDPCFKTREWKDRQLAEHRIRIHHVDQNGGETFCKRVIDICLEHYEAFCVTLGIPVTKVKP